MCLYVSSKTDKPSVQCIPLTVYKVFRKLRSGIYKTPIMNAIVSGCKGTIMEPRFTMDDKLKDIGLFGHRVINEGFIHSFKTVDDCVNFIKSKSISEKGNFYITECVIPCDTEYYSGDHYVYSFDDSIRIKCKAYASRKLVLGEPKYKVVIKRGHRKGTPVKTETWKSYNIQKIL